MGVKEWPERLTGPNTIRDAAFRSLAWSAILICLGWGTGQTMQYGWGGAGWFAPAGGAIMWWYAEKRLDRASRALAAVSDTVIYEALEDLARTLKSPPPQDVVDQNKERPNG